MCSTSFKAQLWNYLNLNGKYYITTLSAHQDILNSGNLFYEQAYRHISKVMIAKAYYYHVQA